MDRFQMIQQASQMKKLRYNNRPIRAGFVDLTLRLGLPNQDYCDNYPTDIGQSLNSSLFNPQQVSLNYFNGSHMSTRTHDDQPPMQYWQHGHNNMVSGDHGTDINNYNMIINVAGGPNNFGRFNQTGINMGQITNTESDQAVLSGSQIHYSTPDYSNFNTIMNNPYRSTAISPKPALNDYNINNVLLNPNTTSSTMNTCDGTRRGQLSSRRKNNNRVKKRHSDDDHHHDHDRTVLDVGEEKEEEEEVVVEDHNVVDGGDANYKLRCSNPNCRTQTTPMWRRGPLGPKSLCNACGIKYRKQEERRATEIATAKSGNSSTSTINNLN